MIKDDFEEIDDIQVEVGVEFEDPDGLWVVTEIQMDQVEVEMVGYGNKADWGKRKWVSINEVKWFMSRYGINS